MSIDPLALAREIKAAQDHATSIAPLTARHPGFGLAQAYDVAAKVHEMRLAQGAQPVGRKIGFTNPTMWAALGVDFPVWGRVYTHTLAQDDGGEVRCQLGAYAEPRIEPEIVLHFHSAPPQTRDLTRILACVDWIAHGFELVQSHFPAWQFQAADTVADNALHAALFIARACRTRGTRGRRARPVAAVSGGAVMQWRAARNRLRRKRAGEPGGGAGASDRCGGGPCGKRCDPGRGTGHDRHADARLPRACR